MVTFYLLLLITSSTRALAAAYIVRPTNGSPTLRRFLSPQGIRSRSSRRSSTEGDDDGPQPPPRDGDGDGDGDDDDDGAPPLESDLLFLERFRRRRDGIASAIDAERSLRPPSARLPAIRGGAVASVLAGLSRPHDPTPHFGYEVLYASSTPRWREVHRKSVGKRTYWSRARWVRPSNVRGISSRFWSAPATTAATMPRRWGRRGGGEGIRYVIDFPQETLDYYDGSAWLECRLRDDRTDALLAVLGWPMRRREGDGAWLIDGIAWQDFRDDYRPGIGREEWERIYAVDVHRRTAVGRNFKFEPTTIAMVMESVIGYLSSSEQRRGWEMLRVLQLCRNATSS